MEKFNLIAVISKDKKEQLMCKRSKDPYIGLLNFVGGKVESENSFEEAYRELFEETGISKKDISLRRLIDLTYYDEDIILEIYYGVLKNKPILVEEVNELIWIKLDQDYKNLDKFAGLGNMDFIMSQLMNKIDS